MAEEETKTEPPAEPGKSAEPPKKEEIPIPTVDLNPKPSKAEDLISKANTAAARQEEANKEHARLIAEEKELQVEKTLGGKTEAGTGNKEESPAEYAKKVLAGEDPNPPGTV